MSVVNTVMKKCEGFRVKLFAPLNYTRLLFDSLLIILLFSLLEVVLFRLSLQFVIYESWASWYFPVGLRIVALFILPFRYWPALIFAGVFGQAIHHIMYLDKPIEDLFNIPTRLLSINHVSALLVLALVKAKLAVPTISRLKPLLAIIGAALVYRVIRSTLLLINSNSSYYEGIPNERKFELILTHFLGGFVGILTLIPLGYLIFELWQRRLNFYWTRIVKPISQALILVTIVFSLYAIQPHVIYLLRILAVLPIIWFAYRFGWFGAIAMTLTVNSMIMLNVFGMNQTSILIENQFYIITYALTGMLLGALVNEQKEANQALDIKNLELTKSNEKLVKMSNRNQTLAENLVTIQEEERKHLSQELHDEIGQSITALRTELKILDHKLKHNANDTNTGRLDDVSSQIYESVYSVLNWLRPRVLDDLGLKECLQGSYFKQKLANSNIHYHCKINNGANLNQLNDSLAISIFRICQECVTNSIRHSRAENFYLTIIQTPNSIQLNLSDDGIGIKKTKGSVESKSFGLKGVQERVDSLNGELEFLTKTSGTDLVIKLPTNPNKAKPE
jgi:two-component system sensor histidine kinase UhpB